ncbi:hypothetical protein BRADI_4g38180v3 [Brachypodium distachyon]|uniref:ATPase AAA-type core domain-containing protein n=1 Tax=Brachypodium distachyon TaxID=15368 RepID=A0A0Q3PPX2_BRADI|nr:hypothetical protein BRADI_4g38180v3 [Brachypodium distachyon]
MHMHDNSPGYTQKVSNDLANCVGLRENTVVGIHIRDNLPTSEIVVLKLVMEAEEILKFCTSDHLAHQIGIVHLSMRFPVSRNQNKVGELKVVGALPMATGMFSARTRTYVKQGNKEIQIGVALHRPIFHPVLQHQPKTTLLGFASVSHIVDAIVQKFAVYKSYPPSNYGKCTVVLYGPYNKEAVAREVACCLRMRFESTSAIQFIKDYPDDSVSAVDKFFRSEAVRGPCVLLIDRFDEVAPEAGKGYTYISIVITAKLKYTLEESMNCPNFIIAGARWRCLVEPGIHSRVRDVLFCGPEEEREEWDDVGTCLRHVMTSPHSGGHKRWSTPNIVLYGPVDMSNNICSSFAACRSLKIVRIEAADLLMQYNRVGVVALCFQLDNLDSQVHAFVAVRWWQLIDSQLLQAGRLDKRVFCGSCGMKMPWDFVGDRLLQLQQSSRG